MKHALPSWLPILSELKHEIACVCSGRTHRKRIANLKLTEFWDDYLKGLRVTQARLQLICHEQTPREYADARKPPRVLSSPPNWTDFFKPSVKQEMHLRQAEFMPTTAHAWKQVFNPEPRRTRGEVKAMKFWASHGAARANAQRENNPACPTQEQAKRELHYLEVAAERFNKRPKGEKIHTNWMSYLTESEQHALYPEARTIAIDDAPRLIYYTPPSLVPLPGAEVKRRGRPKGAKDSTPRTRSVATVTQLQQSAAKRAAKERMRTMSAQRRAGIDPHDQGDSNG